MTPEELDRIEQRAVAADSPPYTTVPDMDVKALIAALREAWEGIASNIARTDEEIADLTDERDSLRAALDRVRALCGQMNFIDATLVLAVIEGES